MNALDRAIISPPPPPPDTDYVRGCDVPVWLKMISLLSVLAWVGAVTFFMVR